MKESAIAVVGVGPIGGILAAHLASGGERVVLVDILQEHIEAIRTTGLEVTGLKELRVVVPDATTDMRRLRDFELDAVFVATKVGPSRQVVADLAKVLGPDTTVVSHQNGLHAEEAAAKVFGSHRTLRMVLNYAGSYEGPGRFRFTFFQKANALGAVDAAGRPRADALAARLNAVGMSTEVVDDIVRYDWEKVILNAILAPICAIVNLDMKDSLACEGVPDLADGLLRECIEVARAEHLDWGPGFFERCQAFIRNGGHHVPSMLVDVRAGRETEIDLICGEMVRLGRKHGIDVPYNATMTTLVKAVSARAGGGK